MSHSTLLGHATLVLRQRLRMRSPPYHGGLRMVYIKALLSDRHIVVYLERRILKGRCAFFRTSAPHRHQGDLYG